MKGVRQVSLDGDNAVITLSVSEKVYPREAIMQAAFTFVDRCYLFLSPGEAEGEVSVQIRVMDPGENAREELERLVGEFANEALNCALRHRIAERTIRLREIVMARALYGSEIGDSSAPPVDPPESLEDDFDYFEDPYGIAIPWEEKQAQQAEGKAPPPSGEGESHG